MRRYRVLPLLIALAYVFLPSATQAQTGADTLTLKIHRDFGYGGGSKIQGNFSLTAEGPQGLIEVEFRIDDEVVMVDNEAPFKFSFHTGDFPTGSHTFVAVGKLADGRQLTSNTFTYEFISAEESKAAATKLLVPILALVVGVVVLGSLVPFLLRGRKQPFELGRYGMAGGTVCPRCGFPYSRNMFSPNLVIGKLGRCPHCGKWALGRRASPQALEQAEERYRRDAQSGPELATESHDDEMRRLLDESKFDR